MKMILRRVTASDAREAADFLDGRTLVLRWLVAFLRNYTRLPDEEEHNWSIWRGDRVDPPGLACVAAHFFHNGTTYLAADPDADGEALEDLLDAELLPEKVLGDEALLTRWRREHRWLEERASAWRRILVLGSTEGGAEPAGFRAAVARDLPVLEEFGGLLEVESGEEHARDFATLIQHGLVFVLEREGRIGGFVRSNFSDGRHVHAGGLYVHPLYRGKGFGTALARGLAARVASTSGVRVILDAYEDNERAVRAYRRAGYEILGAGLEGRFDEGSWQGG